MCWCAVKKLLSLTHCSSATTFSFLTGQMSLPCNIPLCIHNCCTQCTVSLSYYYNHFTALWTMSGTTRVSQYQKKHSPTHTYRGHQSSLICFLHPLQAMASSLFNLHVWQSFFYNLSPSFLSSTSWTGILSFILHTFFHPIIASFLQHMPIPSQPVLLQYRNYEMKNKAL